MAKKQDEISQESAQAAQLITAALKEGNITLSQQEELLDKILNKQIKGYDAITKAIIQAEKEKDVIEGQNKLLERQQAIEEKSIKNQEDITNILTRQRQNTQDLVTQFGNLADLSANQVAAKKVEIVAEKKRLAILASQVDKSSEAYAAILQARQELLDQETILENITALQDNKQAQAIAGAYDQANEAVDKMEKNIKGVFDKLPGGGMLSKMMGVDTFGKKMKAEVVKSFSMMNMEIAKGNGLMGALKAGMKGFNAIVMVNPLLLVVAAGAALFALLSDTEKKSEEIAKATGMTEASSRRLYKQTLNRNRVLEGTLAGTKEMLSVQQEITKEFGSAGMLSNELANSVAQTGEAFGYGAQQAGQIQASFQSMGMSAEEAADTQREFAADAVKNYVDAGKVMQDIAQNSGKAAKYLGGNYEALKNAAIEGAKLGVSLDKMVGIADGLLDIESSLQAQFEFQALSGKQINLDKARQYALEGKISEATKEVMDNVGSIEDFNKMGRFEREKLAKAVGMEVGDLQKSLALQKHRNSLTDDQLAAAQGLNKSAEELAKMSSKEIEDELAKQQAAQAAQKGLDDAIESLKMAFLPLAEALSSVFAALGPILTVAFTPLRWIGHSLEFLLTKLGPISDILKVIAGIMLVKWIRSKLVARQQQKQLANMVKQNEQEKALAEMAERRAKAEKQAGKAMKGQKGTLAEIQENQAKGGKGFMGKAKGLLGKAGSFLGSGKGMALAGTAYAGYNMLKDSGMFGGDEEEVKQTGDLKINPNGGPVVASPREGGIYQGTKNDGLAMAPGAEGGGGPAIDYQALGAAVAAAIAANPPVVNLDGKQVSDTVSAQQSYDKGIK